MVSPPNIVTMAVKVQHGGDQLQQKGKLAHVPHTKPSCLPLVLWFCPPVYGFLPFPPQLFLIPLVDKGSSSTFLFFVLSVTVDEAEVSYMSPYILSLDVECSHLDKQASIVS